MVKLSTADIHPIQIRGKHFVDSVTNEPFFIKGVDYQPGGSSDVVSDTDPLSDIQTCSRDIALFQDLGINTIRIYSVNPKLNHDKCMTLLAMAGIYLILDVNSPLPNQHLNRYEPWNTYNEDYMEHIFSIIENFAPYNNTLGFFAGNEIINDMKSAQVSPAYVKKIVSDMKRYIQQYSTRKIPVGYSAADDLNYRISLANYLECMEDKSNDFSSVDFYGVNSYQWCGKQTMESSGYDKLVKSYSEYSKPVMFSEFGCNRVQPREFEEIQALFSKDMYSTFSGGLVYEFTQQSNNYGLVKLDMDNNVHLLPDYTQLQKQYVNVKLPDSKDLLNTKHEKAFNPKKKQIVLNKLHPPICKSKYDNLNIEGTVAKGISTSLMKNRVQGQRGKYVTLNDDDFVTNHKIYDADGNEVAESKLKVKIVNHISGTESEKEFAEIIEEDTQENDSHDGEKKKKNQGSLVVGDIPKVLMIAAICFVFAY